jgi:hypothetical protein
LFVTLPSTNPQYVPLDSLWFAPRSSRSPSITADPEIVCGFSLRHDAG